MRKLGIIFLFILGATSYSCKQQPTAEETQRSGAKGWGSKSVVFNSTTINVCFENDGKHDLDIRSYRGDIEKYITSEFSKTVIKFVGWGDCESFKSTYDGIRISFLGDGETRVGSYGQSNLGVVDGQGFLRKKMGDYVYSPTLAINGGRFLRHNPRGGTTLRAVNANTLLHEIGHGVGLLHEHVRDSSCSNYGEQSYDSYMARYSEEQKKELYIETPKADPNSIMNYCYVLGSSDKSRFAGLSPGDVEIINGLYSDVEEDDGIDWPFSLD